MIKKMEMLTKEIVKSNGKEFHTFEIKKNDSQIPLLFAFIPEDDKYLLYSDNLREWVIITPDREYYRPYLEFIQSKMEMIIAR
jgi:hypothetical protein